MIPARTFAARTDGSSTFRRKKSCRSRLRRPLTLASPRVLVAGLGNVFLGDDAFGVEGARRLLTAGLPPEVRVLDAGIRSVHLGYELREAQYETTILVDVVCRGGHPG